MSCACFECALYCGVLEGKAPESVSSPYYAQIDWRDRELKSSSLTPVDWWRWAISVRFGRTPS